MAAWNDAPVLRVQVIGRTLKFSWEVGAAADRYALYEWIDGARKYVNRFYTLEGTLENVALGTHVYSVYPVAADGTHGTISNYVTAVVTGELLVQQDSMTAIADAIRGVTQESGKLTPAQMAEAVGGMSKILHGTEDLTEGESALATGVYYFYESQ